MADDPRKGSDGPDSTEPSGDTTESAYTQGETQDSDSPSADDPYSAGEDLNASSAALTAPAEPPGPPGPPAPPPSAASRTPEEEEEEEMLRMSFLEHLEELRARLIRALAGLGVAFVFCLLFANQLWLVVSEPAVAALKRIGAAPNLVQLSPTDAFTTIWVKLPMLAALFLASPWILYQAWAFIAPGLYRRERRLAGPFILSTAGLFIAGGLFAYFVAFRFGLEFLLSIGRDINVTPAVSLVEYFDLFVNVTLGIGLVFELPTLIFFLTLLRLASPRFLLANSRYAILIIVVIAAIITPTPDVFNLMIFSAPMILLYFVGLFASYMLVLKREGGRFPWKWVLVALGVPLVLAAGVIGYAVLKLGYKLVLSWPFLVR